MLLNRFAFVVSVVAAHSANACDPQFATLQQAQETAWPLKTLKDCSFTDVDASSDDNESFDTRYVIGLPVRDLGNGRVAQRLSEEYCSVTEHLLFVDCSSGESVLIRGVEEPGNAAIGYFRRYLIQFIQKPYGKIEVTPTSTVDNLTRTAKSSGLTVIGDVNRYLETGYSIPDGRVVYSPAPRFSMAMDRYDINCGCKLFYPELPGVAD